MSIEEEIQHLITFLSHPAGYDVDMAGMICIRPIDEYCPPKRWEVDWLDPTSDKIVDTSGYNEWQEFNTLAEAARFFVSKRHADELGLDFEAAAWRRLKGEQEHE